MAAPVTTRTVSVDLTLLGVSGATIDQSLAERFLDAALRRYITEGYEADPGLVLDEFTVSNQTKWTRS